VSEIIKKIVISSPFLEEGLSRGIINLSALAREIQPRIEKELIKPVSESAILMALKRYSAKMRKSSGVQEKVLKNISDLTIRSNLHEYTYASSESILEKQKKLLHEIDNRRDKFVTFTQGLFEFSMIVNANLEKTVERIFSKEKMLLKLTDLCALILKLPPAVVHTPGIHYTILKQLAWENINVIEEISTFTEFTLILEKHQIDHAFTVLKRFLWK
jgi:aspartokinase